MLTQQEKQQMVKEIFFITKKNNYFEFLTNLYERWQDEKQYENFNDYKKVIKQQMKEFNIKNVTKRPFGIVFNYKDNEFFYGLKVDGKYVKGILTLKTN
jgi:hypothetical protein